MIKKYAVLLMLGTIILPISLSAQHRPQTHRPNAQLPTLRTEKGQTASKQQNSPFDNSTEWGATGFQDITSSLKEANEQAAKEAAAAESKDTENTAADNATQSTVWTCAFCGEPILHDHQKCTNRQDNPFGVCTHKDLNWGTPLHKGRHHEGREKSSYNVPFEPQQVVIEQKVWTCAFCGEPIVHDHQKCTNQQDNPFGVCTHKDLNYGTPLHKGEHREGREKSRYNVPFEPKQIVISESETPQTSAENNQ